MKGVSIAAFTMRQRIFYQAANIYFTQHKFILFFMNLFKFSQSVGLTMTQT